LETPHEGLPAQAVPVPLFGRARFKPSPLARWQQFLVDFFNDFESRGWEINYHDREDWDPQEKAPEPWAETKGFPVYLTYHAHARVPRKRLHIHDLYGEGQEPEPPFDRITELSFPGIDPATAEYTDALGDKIEQDLRRILDDENKQARIH
jgi:hypothetical protein